VVSNLSAKPHKKVVSNTLNGVECYHDTHHHTEFMEVKIYESKTSNKTITTLCK